MRVSQPSPDEPEHQRAGDADSRAYGPHGGHGFDRRYFQQRGNGQVVAGNGRQERMGLEPPLPQPLDLRDMHAFVGNDPPGELRKHHLKQATRAGTHDPLRIPPYRHRQILVTLPLSSDRTSALLGTTASFLLALGGSGSLTPT